MAYQARASILVVILQSEAVDELPDNRRGMPGGAVRDDTFSSRYYPVRVSGIHPRHTFSSVHAENDMDLASVARRIVHVTKRIRFAKSGKHTVKARRLPPGKRPVPRRFAGQDAPAAFRSVPAAEKPVGHFATINFFTISVHVLISSVQTNSKRE